MNKISSWYFEFIIRLLFIFKKFELLIISSFSVLVVLSGLLFLTPILHCNSGSQICRICGDTKTNTTYHWGTFQIRQIDTTYYRHSIKTLYETFIQEPHDHQWCGGYQDEKIGSLLMWISTDRRMTHNMEEVSMYFYPRLTQMAMISAVKLRYCDQDLRKQIYFSIINSTSPEDYLSVCQVFSNVQKLNYSDSLNLWQEWLDKKNQGGITGKSGNQYNLLPSWTYFSAPHVPSNEIVELEPKRLRSASDYSRNWFCFLN